MADREAREQAIRQATTLVRTGSVWLRPATSSTHVEPPKDEKSHDSATKPPNK